MSDLPHQPQRSTPSFLAWLLLDGWAAAIATALVVLIVLGVRNSVV